MNYILPQLHYDAGVGHQFINWSLGFITSKLFDCEFIHAPFNDKKRNLQKNNDWDNILNFGQFHRRVDQIQYENIMVLPVVDLGHIDSSNWYFITKDECLNRLKIWRDIISNTNDTLFKLPFNMYVGNLSELVYDYCSSHMKRGYWYKNKPHIFAKKKNIVIHIRRGDIDKHVHSHRWVDIFYYSQIIKYLKRKYGREYDIHIISEGVYDDFNTLQQNDVVLHINKDDIVSFNMMCSCDILITGKSSFSFLAAYINPNKIYYLPCLMHTKWEHLSNFTNIHKLIENEVQTNTTMVSNQ